jgi:hypothetical protein
MPRQDTQLESEGAEFLVLGQLLIEGIPAYKTYTNLRGYDLVATWPETNRSARIQVKSRWATNAKQFLIKEIDCDFVVLVRLNRGYRLAAAEKMTLPPQDPEFYDFTSWRRTRPKHSLLIMKRVGPKFVGWSSALSPIGESGAQSETSSRFQ